MKSLFLVGLSATLVLSITNSDCGRKPNDACGAFFRLSAQQQEIEFRKYPLGKQLVLYKCGMRLHPKTIGFAYLIAEDQSTVPNLIDSVKNEPDEYIKTDLIYIFEVLANRGELKGRHDVERQLQNIVSTMHGEAKERAAQSLLRISQSIAQ